MRGMTAALPECMEGGVAASLLLCDNRSGTSADRAPADAWKSSRASVCGSSSDPLPSSERRSCGSAFAGDCDF